MVWLGDEIWKLGVLKKQGSNMKGDGTPLSAHYLNKPAVCYSKFFIAFEVLIFNTLVPGVHWKVMLKAAGLLKYVWPLSKHQV